MMTERLEQHGIQKTVNRTRLKETIREHFPNLTEEKGIRNRVFIVCSETARKIISDATQTPDGEARTLLMAASILRKAVLNHETAFKFDGSFPKGCEESSVPERMKYFFRQLLLGLKSSPEETNSRKILSVSQVAMLNMTSLSLFQLDLLTSIGSVHGPAITFPNTKQDVGRTSTHICVECLL